MHRNKGLLALMFVLAAGLTFAAFNFQRYPDMVIRADGEGYYMYLPATHIHGSFRGLSIRTPEQFKPIAGSDIVYTKYTYGVALMEWPFFSATYLLFDGDGYGRPYGRAVMIAALVYAMLGLWVLGNVLLRWFSPLATGAALFCIVAGTNFYFYLVMLPAMSHVYLFCLVALFMLATIRYYEKPAAERLLAVAALVALMVLIRPTNIVIALFFFLYQVHTLPELRDRLVYWLRQWRQVALFPLMGVLFFIPQLFYWKYALNQWVSYSYQNEGFIYWKSPYVFSVLFGHTDSLFVYTPMALLMVGGALATAWQRQYNGAVLLVIFSLATYLFASWWCWWFGAAFGHRCYIEFYALLAIPFAWVFEQFFRHWKGWKRVPVYLLLLVFIYYNIGMSYLLGGFTTVWDGPNWGWGPYFDQVKRLINFDFP